MKNIIYIVLCVIALSCDKPSPKKISFYEVPLVCGADAEIGCGSRIKPLFIETGKENSIKESWTNKEGTVIAIVWNGYNDEKLMESIFDKNSIDADLINDENEENELMSNFRNKDKWLQGMDVDQLSLREAGTIANSATQFALEKNVISKNEAELIRQEIENYFKKELVKVRTLEALSSEETENEWMREIYSIYAKHIGVARADSAKEIYLAYKEEMKKNMDACCDNKKLDCCETKTTESLQTEVTCPNCGHKKMETMPTDACVIRYTCEQCKTELTPKNEDCCVFCTYGSVKCPSKQT